MNTLKLNMIKRMFDYYINKYNLKEYKLIFTDKTSFYGFCSWRSYIIALSKRFIDNADLIHIKYTLLHEIAHAITKQGHNRIFYNKCIELNIPASRFHSQELSTKLTIIKKYTGTCSICGHTWKRDRIRKGSFCVTCKNKIAWVKN